MLIHAGINIRAVASRMGHANPNVTLAVYSYALQSADKQSAAVLENLVTKRMLSKISRLNTCLFDSIVQQR